MPNTTVGSSSFTPITAADLSSVQGGCNKKKCCCPKQSVAAVAAVAAPAPAPAPAPRDSIESSVQISGYGA